MLISINTAQNVNIDCKLAGLTHRIGATLLDLAFRGGIILLVTYLLNVASVPLLQSRMVIIWIVVIFTSCYHLIFEYLLNGKSPGKMICRIRVVRIDGQKLSFWDCLLRWSLRLIDTTAMGIVAIISIVVSSRMQRLGDLAAGTVVILEKNGVPLREISLYDTPDDYQVVFPQVSMLTDKDIAIIKEVMHEVEQQREYQLLVPLASRVRTLTGIQTRMDNLAFMQTVLKDYIHLTKK